MPDPTRREMLRITAVAGLGVGFGVPLIASLVRDARLHHVRRTEVRMGTLVSLSVVHPHEEEAHAMVSRGFHEMARLEGLLSRHRDDTPVGRLNAGLRLDPAPEELLLLLTEARRLSERSEGAFDITVAPLLELYEASFRHRGEPPTSAEIREARALVDFRGVVTEGAAVRLADPRMAITLDGIAKGYVVDRTVDVLVSRGAERVMVDAGGDIGSRADPRDPWTVALQDPLRLDRPLGRVDLAGTCVATSGDYQGSWGADRSVHHILDPRTGRSPSELASVSVVAASAMEADALSTAVMVMGVESGSRLLAETAGAEGLMVTKGGRRVASAGFPAGVPEEVERG